MKSHENDFVLRELGAILGAVLVPAVIIAAVLRLAAAVHIMPAPWPATDLEHTVLTHQAKASRTPNPATILLIGDSSCLMGVSADRLKTSPGEQALNLGTFMYVGFQGYATLVARYAAANPTSLQKVVVLVHPEMLRGIEPVPHYLDFIAAVQQGEDFDDRSSTVAQLRGLFGLNILMNRVVGRLPLALPGEYGRAYGFNINLDAYMAQHKGSAFDPHEYHPGPSQGNAEYRFASALEPGCRALRAAVPSSAKLIVGLTPVPASFAPQNYKARAQQILAEWARALGADQSLTNLPTILPDSAFASTTHLNRRGAEDFTRELSNLLSEP